MLPDPAPELETDEALRVLHERDLYRTLLDLGTHSRIELLIEKALGLIARACSAEKGYLELFDERAPELSPLRWHVSLGCSQIELDEIREMISGGIIAQALASGQPIATASALLDERFRERKSVRQNRIEAVLCVPIGADPPFGVLYLQGRTAGGPFNDEDLKLATMLARYLAVFADRLLARRLLSERADPTKPYRDGLRLQGFVGRSRAVADVLMHVAMVAKLDVSVLLSGPSGTGKTQIARIVHDNSRRAHQAFVELNCAAIPESLLESELFGAVPGAHSTATKRIPGKLSAAEHGTLFLDEVGELPLGAQSKLLQFLQSRTYYPLGSNKAIGADVRVLAATNADLLEAVKERRFREDLYYRLQVLPIRMPSLAERSEDIPELLYYFCERSCAAHGFGRLGFSPAAVRAALCAEWPGNLRQLANAVEAAVIRAEAVRAQNIEREHLFPTANASPSSRTGAPTFQEATRAFQRDLLLECLKENDWNITLAAERLDLARSHVYNLIRAFGLEKSSPS